MKQNKISRSDCGAVKTNAYEEPNSVQPPPDPDLSGTSAKRGPESWAWFKRWNA